MLIRACRQCVHLHHIHTHTHTHTLLTTQVKDAEKKYHFNPKELVTGITLVYLNLGEEQAFCEALPRDGRSFSMDLFIQVERVLW